MGVKISNMVRHPYYIQMFKMKMTVEKKFRIMWLTSNYMISTGNYRLIGPSKILNFQIARACICQFKISEGPINL